MKLPDGMARSICPRCGREILIADTDDGQVALDVTPRTVFVLEGGKVRKAAGYQAHLVTCHYRSATDV